jgi:hypothetical protein
LIKKLSLEDIVKSLKVVGKPAATELVDIHYNSDYVSFKFIENRLIQLEQRNVTGDEYTVKKISQRIRAVTIARAFSSGALEFRLEARQGTPSYQKIVDETWTLINDFLPREKFREKELRKLKRTFTIHPSEAVKKLVRVRVARGTDKDGVKYLLATGAPDGNLLGSHSVLQGIEALAGASNSRPGHTSVAFLPQTNKIPSRELGVVLAGSINEVRVLASCTREEYEYIRGRIEEYS